MYIVSILFVNILFHSLDIWDIPDVNDLDVVSDEPPGLVDGGIYTVKVLVSV